MDGFYNGNSENKMDDYRGSPIGKAPWLRPCPAWAALFFGSTGPLKTTKRCGGDCSKFEEFGDYLRFLLVKKKDKRREFSGMIQSITNSFIIPATPSNPSSNPT